MDDTYTQTENNQTGPVWRSYGKWFLIAAIFAILASLVACLVNLYHPLNKIVIQILQISGAIIEATALGQCGFTIQTWEGVSKAEKLNSRLFWFFSVGGLVLLVFSFQLEIVVS